MDWQQVLMGGHQPCRQGKQSNSACRGRGNWILGATERSSAPSESQALNPASYESDAEAPGAVPACRLHRLHCSCSRAKISLRSGESKFPELQPASSRMLVCFWSSGFRAFQLGGSSAEGNGATTNIGASKNRTGFGGPYSMKC